MEASRTLLVSYLDSLINIKTCLSSYPSKGKTIVTYDNRVRRPHLVTGDVGPEWCEPEVGWEKSNTDESDANDGTVGACMVLRD